MSDIMVTRIFIQEMENPDSTSAPSPPPHLNASDMWDVTLRGLSLPHVNQSERNLLQTLLGIGSRVLISSDCCL